MFRFVKPVMLLVAALVLVMGALNCAAPAEEPTPTKPILIRIATPMGETDTKTIAANDFKKKAEERTKGRLKFEVYPAGALFKDKDIPTALSQGMVEMTINHITWWAGVLPIGFAVTSSILFTNREHFWRALDGDLGKMIVKELETKHNTKLLSYFSHGPTDVHVCNKKLLREPADFKGLKLRGPGVVYEHYYLSLGASPIAMSVGDVYLALERGTIDGCHTSDRAYLGYKFYEAARYVTRHRVSFDETVLIAMNLATWNKLPSDIQKVLLKVAGEELEWSKTESYRLNEENWSKIKLLPKIEIYVVPPETAKKFYDLTYPAQVALLKTSLGTEQADRVTKLIEKYK